MLSARIASEQAASEGRLRFVNRLIRDKYRYERIDGPAAADADTTLLDRLRKSLDEPRTRPVSSAEATSAPSAVPTSASATAADAAEEAPPVSPAGGWEEATRLSLQP